MLDFMIENKIGKINLVSNSSYYLLYFGVFFTSDVAQILLNPEEPIPNPIEALYAGEFLTITSCAVVRDEFRKVSVFKNFAKDA